jgi:hypothetical protein
MAKTAESLGSSQKNNNESKIDECFIARVRMAELLNRRGIKWDTPTVAQELYSFRLSSTRFNLATLIKAKLTMLQNTGKGPLNIFEMQTILGAYSRSLKGMDDRTRTLIVIGGLPGSGSKHIALSLKKFGFHTMIQSHLLREYRSLYCTSGDPIPNKPKDVCFVDFIERRMLESGCNIFVADVGWLWDQFPSRRILQADLSFSVRCKYADIVAVTRTRVSLLKDKGINFGASEGEYLYPNAAYHLNGYHAVREALNRTTCTNSFDLLNDMSYVSFDGSGTPYLGTRKLVQSSGVTMR